MQWAHWKKQKHRCVLQETVSVLLLKSLMR
jgi:hypothetical protein